jgi:hypothetical protein
MRPLSSNLGEPSESFRLHYVQGTRRCVVSYDTLEAALEAAFKRLEKDRSLAPWISDDAKHILFDAAQVRARFAQREQRKHGGRG